MLICYQYVVVYMTVDAMMVAVHVATGSNAVCTVVMQYKLLTMRSSEDISCIYVTLSSTDSVSNGASISPVQSRRTLQ
jgi:hypothetical protein